MADNQGYKVRFSTAAHFGAIRDFYSSDARRTANVFARPNAVLEEQASLGRFITVWNQEEKLVAASSLYVLANGKEIDCIVHDGGYIERGRVVELGSVLRIGHDPQDPPVDKGFWRLILFGIPMIAALQFDLPIDILIAGVNNTHSGERTKDYIRGEYEGSPLHYGRVTPAEEFLRADGVAVGNASLSNSQHFRAYVADVLPVAKCLLKIIESGTVIDLRPRSSIGYDPYMKVPVNLHELEITPLLKSILDNRSLTAVTRTTPRTLSWGAAGRELRNRISPSMRGLTSPVPPGYPTQISATPGSDCVAA